MMQDSGALEALKIYATPAQLEVIDAVIRLGSIASAARELSLHAEAARARIREAKKRAASRGHAPEHDWTHAVPEGHRVRGNSTLYGPGGVENQWVKSERDSDEPPDFQPVPPGHHVSKVSTLLDSQGKVRAQWVQAPQDKVERDSKFWVACKEAVEEYRGLSQPVEAPKFADADLITAYPLGDPHIGMLAWGAETGQSFDVKIATDDLYRTVDMLVDRAPPSRTGILINLGDFFHAQDDKQQTPMGGNKLDVDTRSGKVMRAGFNVMRRMVDGMLRKHELVSVVNTPGNHDPQVARMLAMWLQAVYEHESRVVVEENFNPYTYIRHGKVLLGICHGDGAKPGDLQGIMATDRPQDWGETLFRYWLQGHVHHKSVKECRGCTVETFRTLAPEDYWAYWKGYRSGQSLDCITYHHDFGEVSRSTVDITLSRAKAS